MAPSFFDAKHFAAAPQEAGQAVERLGLIPPAPLLDLACGPGRHALALARQGFQVTGVDRCAFLLAQARRRACREGLRIEFVRADMRNFGRPCAFAGILNLSTSFGYFQDPAEDRMVLAHIFRSLQPGGAFLLQMLNLPAARASFRASESQTGPQGMWILEKRKLSQGGRWFEKRRTLFRFGKPLGTFHVAHRLFFRRELRSLLSQAGFGRVEFFGSLSGVPYRPRSPFLVAAAWKVKG